jgi:ParB family chromosome partitioning protein
VTIPAKRSIRQIPLNDLIGHELNPADRLDEQGISELADSIREHGLLQPLVVTEHPTEYDRWLILAGHRRATAARLAGRTSVPCVIRHNLDDDPDEQLVVMLVENCQRKQLTPMQRAEAFGVLRNRGLTLAEIGRRMSITESAVSATLSLLNLDTETREKVRHGEISANAARQAVVEVRQETRKANGHKPNGRPARTEPQHFTRRHPLAAKVKAACSHGRRPRVGGVGCGQCWEDAIRADAGQAVALRSAS